MKLQKKLEKLGIQQESMLQPEEINNIAHNVANKLTIAFPCLQMEYNEILAKMLNCKIYYANIPNNMSSVNYIYEDDSIYVDTNFDASKLNEQFFHEAIHYLQVARNKNNKIKRMGLCKFGDFSIMGLGINEAMVQYMAAKIMGNMRQNKQTYGLYVRTISPDCYPILTNLMEQIIYLMGEDIAVQSTINADEIFEEEFYNTFEEKGSQIIKNFDQILEMKNYLATAQNEQEIDALAEQTVAIYINTQETILKKYYNTVVPRLSSTKEVNFCMDKLLNNVELIGIKADGTDNFYEQYKDEVIKKLDKQYIKLSREEGRNTLSKYNNRLARALKKTISYFWN